MNPPSWEAFARRAAEQPVCGFFEWRIPDDPARHGVFSYLSASGTIILRRSRDLGPWRSALASAMEQRPGRGVVGYLGFDAAHLFDRSFGAPPRGSPFPLGEFALIEKAWTGSLQAPEPLPRSPPAEPAHPVEDTMTRSRFIRGVLRLQSEIRAGNAYQVVLAHRRSFPRPVDLLARAGRLRQRERFAFFYYLRFDDREILGASPESVLEATGDRAFISPIAGTRPRHRGASRRVPLHRDSKELAEHRMLVDLARNDLGRIAIPGSVRLLSTEQRERYSRLEHLVSRVGGTPEPGIGPGPLLEAAFPAGTVCGAPKVRATRLLREVEGSWRGPYGGAVGVTHHGESLWGLAIRSAFAKGSTLYTAAGAGVVVGSKPAQEWEETLLKLAELESTLVGPGTR